MLQKNNKEAEKNCKKTKIFLTKTKDTGKYLLEGRTNR